MGKYFPDASQICALNVVIKLSVLRQQTCLQHNVKQHDNGQVFSLVVKLLRTATTILLLLGATTIKPPCKQRYETKR